jgi:hypothetical protein
MYMNTDIDEVYVRHKCDSGDEFFVKMIKPKNTNHLLYLSDSSIVCPVCQASANKLP